MCRGKPGHESYCQERSCDRREPDDRSLWAVKTPVMSRTSGEKGQMPTHLGSDRRAPTVDSRGRVRREVLTLWGHATNLFHPVFDERLA
jgi:hypothetical protein